VGSVEAHLKDFLDPFLLNDLQVHLRYENWLLKRSRHQIASDPGLLVPGNRHALPLHVVILAFQVKEVRITILRLPLHPERALTLNAQGLLKHLSHLLVYYLFGTSNVLDEGVGKPETDLVGGFLVELDHNLGSPLSCVYHSEVAFRIRILELLQWFLSLFLVIKYLNILQVSFLAGERVVSEPRVAFFPLLIKLSGGAPEDRNLFAEIIVFLGGEGVLTSVFFYHHRLPQAHTLVYHGIELLELVLQGLKVYVLHLKLHGSECDI